MKMMMKSTHDEMLLDEVKPSADRQIPLKVSAIQSSIPEVSIVVDSSNSHPPSRNVIGNKSLSFIDPKPLEPPP